MVAQLKGSLIRLSFSAESYNYISDLDTLRDSWKLKVRVLSTWKTTYQLETIVMDERGDKIHAVVKMNLCHVFEKSLEEGMVVLLSKFGVGENKGKYPILRHRYKINFYRCTSVKSCSKFDGPLHGFNFFDFSLINEYLQDPHLPVDIIGCVVECGNLEVYDKPSGKQGVLHKLELEDLEGVKVKCTLWDDFAEQFHAYVAGRTIDHHLVIVLQFGRIRTWKEPTFQNNYFGSKLYIDTGLEEINDFRKRFICRVGSATSSQGCSQLSSQRVHSIHEDFLFNTKHYTIDEIVNASEPLICVVLATIKSVEEEHGWFYIACRKHKCKAVRKTEFVHLYEIDETEADDSLYCKKCEGKTKSVFPSYKVRVRVQDATGSTSFVLFDRDVYKLVQKHASDIRETQETDGSDDGFPDEFISLIEKMLLFKVEVSNYNIDIGYQVYTVLKVCSDPKIITDFLDMHPDDNDGGGNNEEEIYRKEKDVVSSTDDSSVGITEENATATSPASKRPRKCDEKEIMAQTSTSKKRVLAVKIEKP